MTAPKRGDRVRVEYDAEFRERETAVGPYVLVGGSGYYVPPGATVTVLQPAWKVGDVLDYVSQLVSLPACVVVITHDRDNPSINVATGRGTFKRPGIAGEFDARTLRRPVRILHAGGHS